MNKIQISKDALLSRKGDALLVAVLENEAWSAELKALDKALKGLLTSFAKKSDFKGQSGKSMQLSAAAGSKFDQIILLGLGKMSELENDAFHTLGARISSVARQSKATTVHIKVDAMDADPRTYYSLAMGIHLGSYQFDKYLKKPADSKTVSFLIFQPSGAKASQLPKAIQRAGIVAQAVMLARDLINEPPCVMTPAELSLRARKVAQKGKLKIKIFNEKQIAAMKMNLFLAVGAGSTRNPPRFIHMSHVPRSKKGKAKIFLIGKGVTFDSGGLSLKPGTGMMTMKMDMSGAAAVIATMQCMAALKPALEIHALVAATENMPDGDACRPGDIVKGKDGTSVEILNTDAEGRLTLADAITYAKEQGATEIIDVATLTGACMTALGLITGGLYSNSDELAAKLLQAGEAEAEHLWRMPLTKKLKKSITTPVADLKNIGGSYGGSITAALFLEHFIGQTTWAHLDIAGPAFSEEESGHIKKGGRGFTVATLVEFLSPL